MAESGGYVTHSVLDLINAFMRSYSANAWDYTEEQIAEVAAEMEEEEDASPDDGVLQWYRRDMLRGEAIGKLLDQVLESAGFTIAAVLAGSLAAEAHAGLYHTDMPASFFATKIRFGERCATLIEAVGTAIALTLKDNPEADRRLSVAAATVGIPDRVTLSTMEHEAIVELAVELERRRTAGELPLRPSVA